MQNQSTGYWKYNVKNVFDVDSLSSYALEQTPLKFIPTSVQDIVYSNYYVIWDFGDGSELVNSLSASHYYFYPGEYDVTMYIMPSSGNSAINSYIQRVKIYDFIPNTYAFKQTLSSNVLSLTAGNYSPLLKLERFNSLQSYELGNYTFFLEVSGSNSLNFDITKLDKEPYSYLLPTHRFINRVKVKENIFSDTVIDTLSTTSSLLYGKLDKTSLVVPTSSKDVDAFFVGTSGYGDFYFVDDLVKNEDYYIIGTFNTNKLPDNYTFYKSLPYKFKLPIKNTSSTYYTISSNVYKKPDFVSITSNGLDGEGFVLDTFNIGKSKFLQQNIAFVAKLKYNNYFSSKNQFNNIIGSYASPANNAVQIYLIDYYSSQNLGNFFKYVKFDTELFKDANYGWVKGSFTIPNINDLYGPVISNNPKVILSAICTMEDNEGNTFTISGSSTPFNLYSSQGVNKVAKVNENFDASTYMKDLAFQPSIYKKPQIFDTFFGTVLGSLSSPVNAIGKRVYEKTANFVNNNVNLDTCNIQALFGYSQQYNVELDEYAKANLLINYPADLSRLVNIFSIKKSLLFGTTDKFNRNFSNRYSTGKTFSTINQSTFASSKGLYDGINLGNPIPIKEGIIHKNENYIVAKELFSEKFSLLRTNLLSSVVSGTTYPLSTFSKSWGWGLILPESLYTDPLSTYKLSSYYAFYKFLPTTSGAFTNNIINWNDQFNTTINLRGNNPLSSTFLPSYLSSYSNTPLQRWESPGGIIEQNISYQLSLGLEILSA